MQKKVVNLILSLCLLVCAVFPLAANTNETLDSLQTANSVEKDKKKIVDNLNLIAEIHGYTDIDKAFSTLEEALHISKSIGYKAGEGEVYFLMGYYNNREGDQEKAIDNFKKACQLFREVGDSSYLVGCYNNLGVMYSYGTDQVKSLRFFIKALNLAEELDESYSLSEAYINVGSYYEYLKEYGSALKYYSKSLEIDLERDDMENISFSHMYVGNMLIKLHRLDEALEHLKEAQRLQEQVKEEHRVNELYLHFADYFVETKELDLAEKYLQLSDNVITKEDYPRLYADLFFTWGDYELERKNFTKSLEYYNKALVQFQEVEELDYLYELYTQMSVALSALGKHNEAYKMLQKANESNESFKPHELAKLLGEFETEQAAKEERKNFLLEKALEDERQEKELIRYRANSLVALLSVILLVIVLGVVLYSSYSRRKHHAAVKENLDIIQKQKTLLEENYKQLENDEKQLKQLNATKDKFFSIIAHDLKNPFNVLIGLSDLIRSDADIRESEEFDQLIEGMFQTASSGYSLLENLLEWSRAQTGSLSFEPEPVLLKNLFVLNSTLFEESAKAKEIAIKIPEEDDKTAFADFNMINFVIRNLLNNAIKFSYSESEINLNVNRVNGYYVVDVQDSGVGMTKDTIQKLFTIEKSIQREGTANEKGTGLGLVLCKEFVEKNGGGDLG